MNVTNETLIKVTGPNATACWGGRGQWNKPHSKNRPGKWMPLIKDIEPCRKGYHICQGPQVLKWLHTELYEVEIRGEQVREKDKIVAQQARLVRRIKTGNERTIRLWACDCAERVSHYWKGEYLDWKGEYLDDNRLVEVIKVARAYAKGKVTEKELRAAYDVSRSSFQKVSSDYRAWNAVNSALYAVKDRDVLPSYSAHSAYYAYLAAEARSKELEWQWNRLLKYLNGELV